MVKNKYLIYGILVIATIGVIFIISGWIGQIEQPSIEQPIIQEPEPQEIAVPSTMEYIGTKYVNCHLNPNYPFQTDQELTTIEGIVEEKTGTRMFPWVVAVVDDKYLFNPETDNLIDNFDELKGKVVTIKGYSGTGQITMKVYGGQPGETTIITFDNAFYVSEIIDWRNICCDATLEDTGIISTPNVCFWFEK